MADLRAIARQLGGEVSSGGIVCPGPGHSRADRSLSVKFNATGDFTVCSFAGDDWRTCKDHVAQLLGREPWRPGGSRQAGKFSRPPRKPVAANDGNEGLAIAIWQNAGAVAGTIAEKYLHNRIGTAGFTDWPTDLRVHPKCPRGDRKLPALICLLRDIRSNQPRAIQRIFLKDDGSDRLRDQMGKATLGPAAGAVCKLSPDDAVTHGLGIAEGVEKSLAIIAGGWSPVWATCGTSGLTAFPVLAGIETLTVFADADEPGQRAALACATRWNEAGVEALIRAPKANGCDWGDVFAKANR